MQRSRVLLLAASLTACSASSSGDPTALSPAGGSTSSATGGTTAEVGGHADGGAGAGTSNAGSGGTSNTSNAGTSNVPTGGTSNAATGGTGNGATGGTSTTMNAGTGGTPDNGEGGGPVNLCGGTPTLGTAVIEEGTITTAAGVTPTIEVDVHSPGTSQADMTAAVLAHFHVMASAAVPLQVVPPTTMMSNQYDLSLLLGPASPLTADTWYALSLDPGGVLPGGFLESVPDPSDPYGCHGASARLFTGSLPQLVRLSRGTDPKKPFSSVSVILSESVSASSLTGGGFSLAKDGVNITGCVMWETCQTTASTKSIGSFDYTFDSPLADGNGTWDVYVRGTVAGVGRTVAEAAAFEGQTLDTSSGVPAVHYVIKDADWKCCGTACDTMCWLAP